MDGLIPAAEKDSPHLPPWLEPTAGLPGLPQAKRGRGLRVGIG